MVPLTSPRAKRFSGSKEFSFASQSGLFQQYPTRSRLSLGLRPTTTACQAPDHSLATISANTDDIIATTDPPLANRSICSFRRLQAQRRPPTPNGRSAGGSNRHASLRATRSSVSLAAQAMSTKENTRAIFPAARSATASANGWVRRSTTPTKATRIARHTSKKKCNFVKSVHDVHPRAACSNFVIILRC